MRSIRVFAGIVDKILANAYHLLFGQKLFRYDFSIAYPLQKCNPMFTIFRKLPMNSIECFGYSMLYSLFYTFTIVYTTLLSPQHGTHYPIQPTTPSQSQFPSMQPFLRLSIGKDFRLYKPFWHDNCSPIKDKKDKPQNGRSLKLQSTAFISTS